jgi:hypothetical protein
MRILNIGVDRAARIDATLAAPGLMRNTLPYSLTDLMTASTSPSEFRLDPLCVH